MTLFFTEICNLIICSYVFCLSMFLIVALTSTIVWNYEQPSLELHMRIHQNSSQSVPPSKFHIQDDSNQVPSPKTGDSRDSEATPSWQMAARRCWTHTEMGTSNDRIYRVTPEAFLPISEDFKRHDRIRPSNLHDVQYNV